MELVVTIKIGAIPDEDAKYEAYLGVVEERISERIAKEKIVFGATVSCEDGWIYALFPMSTHPGMDESLEKIAAELRRIAAEEIGILNSTLQKLSMLIQVQKEKEARDEF